MAAASSGHRDGLRRVPARCLGPWARTVALLGSVGLMLGGVACSAADFPYAEDFDAWPDGGCPVASPTRPCAGSWLHNGDVQARGASGFPCRRGKCVRGVYDENESATYLFPMVADANGTAPARNSVYWRASWYFDPAFDFPGNSVKRARFYGTTGNPALEVGWAIAEGGTVLGIDIYDHEHFGRRVCRVEAADFDWKAPANRGRWVQVESTVTLNDPGSANGSCKIWIDGKLRANEQGYDFRDDASDTLANGWLGGNYSGAGGERFPNIWYMDDVCIAATEAARNGFCAVREAPRP